MGPITTKLHNIFLFLKLEVNRKKELDYKSIYNKKSMQLKNKNIGQSLNILDREIYTKVSGVTFEGRQGYIKNCYPGQQLKLIRDLNNIYDKNAIAIYSDKNQLGFVKKELALKLAPIIDNGIEVEGIVEQVTGGGGYIYGLNIKIVKK